MRVCQSSRVGMLLAMAPIREAQIPPAEPCFPSPARRRRVPHHPRLVRPDRVALRRRELPLLRFAGPGCACGLDEAPPPLLEDLVDSWRPPAPDGRLGDTSRVPGRGARAGGYGDPGEAVGRDRGRMQRAAPGCRASPETPPAADRQRSLGEPF